MFVTFEGGEGTGKSTLMKKVGNELRNQKKKVKTTREPGGILLAEKIRHIILENEMDVQTEAYLYAAARRELWKNTMKPFLNENKENILLCDRFVDSSIVYQGIVKRMGMEAILSLNLSVIDETLPDYTFLLDMDPAKAINRINKDKDREKNRFDKETLSFHQKVREGYLLLAKKFSSRIIILNGEETVETNTEKILTILSQE